MKNKLPRLPVHISPDSYNLFFEPELKTHKFKGTAEIQIKIDKPSKNIILNSKNLKILSTKIKQNNSIIKSICKLNPEDETLTISTNKALTKGNAILSFKFQGTLNDSLAGFYRSKYIDKSGKTKYLATTQFEAPYARKAFPCFDEPDKKAIFNVSLKIPKNLKAISNMPIKKQISQKNKKLVQFWQTPLMSTYLLYMGVGDFEFLQSKYKKVKLRIVTIPGKSKEGKFALEVAKKCLNYFEKFSNIPYPLPKLDLIAIPDFAAGAMENWGAITFREILLLYNPNKTSESVKKTIAEVIAHELWHQWSGNLVTMNWWEDLWLNESFATYMSYKAISHHFPEWKMWEEFVNTKTAGAFKADSLHSTHPIAVTVQNPNEIEEIFDDISYGKGASVLRMIENYLSPETFKKGIQNYLKKFAYNNAKAEDLWNHLAKISKKPIKSVMESWIKQPGYPLISAHLNGNKLHISQKKFSYKITPHKNPIWKIPFTYQLDNKKIIKYLFTKRKETLVLPKKSNWIKINSNQTGFFRVEYNKYNLENLKTEINKKTLSTLDRWGIHNDMFNLTYSGKSSIIEYLNFLNAYKNEQSYMVLSDIYSSIAKIDLIQSHNNSWSKTSQKFIDHIKTPFLNIYLKLLWDYKNNEDYEKTLLRTLAISYLGFAKDPIILVKSSRLFQNHIKNIQELNPNISGTIFSLIAINGSNKDFNSLLKLCKTTKNREEKIKSLSSLYKIENPEDLIKSLNFALTPHVRTQDLRTVFSTTQTNPTTPKIFFQWTKRNWKKLEPFQNTHFVFISLLKSLIETQVKNESEIKKFLSQKKIKYEKTKANSFEKMHINTRFLSKNSLILENYFK